MSLKVRLQLSIIALVAAVVIALSALYIHGIIETRFQDSLDLARDQARQVSGFLDQLVREKTSQVDPRPRNLAEIKRLWTGIVEQDAGLTALLGQLVGKSLFVVEVVVTGEDDRILAASLPARQGQKITPVMSFEDFERTGFWTRLEALLASNQDYEVAEKLGIQGESEPVFTIRVILSTVLLREDFLERIYGLAVVAGLSLLLSILVAVVVSNLAFRPLARIGEIIDRLARGEFTFENRGTESQSKEEAALESKLSVLGEQFRGVQADRKELRANVNQLLDRLEEAVLLFGKDDRLVMAGRGAQRLMGWGRWEAMGKPLAEIFPNSTELGALVQSAVHLRRDVRDHPVGVERDGSEPTRLLVSVEVVEQFPSRERVGTLVTLRDADPRRQIESQLDISSRLAAISRLTSGAAHEIKNPLNSIALHLEVLKSKLNSTDPEAEAEIAVISREITRLDRVVKSFLDFTRPVDLKMERVDLVKIVREVVSLVAADAAGREVEVAVEAVPPEAPMQGDRDLLVQAVLNVVVNGVEAMPQGGRLRLQVEETAGEWQVTVRDQGPGIPCELRDKIYNLYFTTKGKGSGIGLAMAFRVVQLHGGRIEFTSEESTGTEFRLRFPSARDEERRSSQQQPAEPARGSV